MRPKAEDVAVRRVAERNALRCSLLRSEARKKQQAKVCDHLKLRVNFGNNIILDTLEHLLKQHRVQLTKK